jgi:hypothetical protein
MSSPSPTPPILVNTTHASSDAGVYPLQPTLPSVLRQPRAGELVWGIERAIRASRTIPSLATTPVTALHRPCLGQASQILEFLRSGRPGRRRRRQGKASKMESEAPHASETVEGTDPGAHAGLWGARILCLRWPP